MPATDPRAGPRRPTRAARSRLRPVLRLPVSSRGRAPRSVDFGRRRTAGGVWSDDDLYQACGQDEYRGERPARQPSRETRRAVDEEPEQMQDLPGIPRAASRDEATDTGLQADLIVLASEHVPRG